MVLLFFILFFYCLNISILFQGQSLILLLVFYFICILIKNLYIRLQFTMLHSRTIEWIDTMYLLSIFKIWYSILIRRAYYKLYRFYNVCIILKNMLSISVVSLLYSLHTLYTYQFTLNAQLNLERLFVKKKQLISGSQRILSLRNITIG